MQLSSSLTNYVLGAFSSSPTDSYCTVMSHSPVPRSCTLHVFNHAIRVVRSRASHSQTSRPESVSQSTRMFLTSVVSASRKRFSKRATSWRVMQAMACVVRNFGIIQCFAGWRADIAAHSYGRPYNSKLSRGRWARRQDCPTPSNSHRSCAPSHNRADTSAQTTYAMNVRRCGSMR